jgi:hypothetical protein
MRTFLLVAVVGLACWLAGASTNAQEAKDASMSTMAMPKATAEHNQLQSRVGVWDADFKLYMGPQAMESKATMTYESLGDFWVIGRYEGEFMGEKFHGVEISGFDPETKQYVSYWLDNTSSEFSEMRGEWELAAKSMTMHSAEPAMNHMTGEKETMIQEVEIKDDDTLLFKMRPESATSAVMEITYHRRK